MSYRRYKSSTEWVVGGANKHLSVDTKLEGFLLAFKQKTYLWHYEKKMGYQALVRPKDWKDKALCRTLANRLMESDQPKRPGTWY